MTFGFILTSHINSELTNLYWIESYKCIRKLYPNAYVLIIQDNINQSYFKIPTDILLSNIFFITSEFPKSGEILAYYYFYKIGKNFFDKAVIIHDSTFIQKDFVSPIIDQINTFKVLWTFPHLTNSAIHDHSLLRNLWNSKELVEFYEENDKWIGCFGVQSIITYDFLCLLQAKYNLFQLVNRVKDRTSRCSTERGFAVLCYKEDEKEEKTPLLGEMSSEFAFSSFQEYINKIDSLDEDIKMPAYKLFTGR
jgi:hypothetical protein